MSDNMMGMPHMFNAGHEHSMYVYRLMKHFFPHGHPAQPPSDPTEPTEHRPPPESRPSSVAPSVVPTFKLDNPVTFEQNMANVNIDMPRPKETKVITPPPESTEIGRLKHFQGVNLADMPYAKVDEVPFNDMPAHKLHYGENSTHMAMPPPDAHNEISLKMFMYRYVSSFQKFFPCCGFRVHDGEMAARVCVVKRHTDEILGCNDLDWRHHHPSEDKLVRLANHSHMDNQRLSVMENQENLGILASPKQYQLLDNDSQLFKATEKAPHFQVFTIKPSYSPWQRLIFNIGEHQYQLVVKTSSAAAAKNAYSPMTTDEGVIGLVRVNEMCTPIGCAFLPSIDPKRCGR